MSPKFSQFSPVTICFCSVLTANHIHTHIHAYCICVAQYSSGQLHLRCKIFVFFFSVYTSNPLEPPRWIESQYAQHTHRMCFGLLPSFRKIFSMRSNEVHFEYDRYKVAKPTSANVYWNNIYFYSSIRLVDVCNHLLLFAHTHTQTIRFEWDTGGT